MTEHILKILQFEKVASLIAEHCVLDEGRAFCKSLKPSIDIKQIEKNKRYGKDCLALLEGAMLPPLRHLPPVMPFLEEAERGDLLEIEGIYAVFLFVSLVQDLHKWANSSKKELKVENVILNYVDSLPLFDEIFSSLSSFINESGSLKEVPSLRAISKKIEETENDIKRSMAKYSSNSLYSDILQSTLPTTKNNREVLAVKANFKGKIKGIIHEYSNTAKTFYIEPEDVVLKNNLLQELKAEWEREYFLILRRLSNFILESTSNLQSALKYIVELDFFEACAIWANKNKADFLMEEGNTIELKNARHPLIKNCVPLNFGLEGEKRVLIITGANAGGKTVALKTIALLSVMNQCGMPLPLEKSSRLPYFNFIGADIGDEQSIENAASTFSASISNVASIMESANEKSLVIFDELCSGTDVEEGGAIAMAILDEMIEKKVYTIVSTHHGILKNYGFSNTACLNASVSFDLNSLKPLYKIVVGVPGESHALDVAKENGLNIKVVEKAHSYMAEHSSNISEIIHNLIDMQQELQKKEERIIETEKELLEARRVLDLKMLSLRQKELEVKQGSLKTAVKLFDEKKKGIENLVRQVMEGRVEKEDRKELKEWMCEVGSALQVEKENIKKEEEALNAFSEVDSCEMSFKSGDVVYSKNYDREGIFLHNEKKGYAIVSFGDIKIKVETSDLRLKNKVENIKLKPIYELEKTDDSLYELSLLGLHFEEAKTTLQEHFDKIIMNDIKEFSIVHGKGSGILQKMVYDALSSSKFVKEFSFARPEFGGSGKTIVTMK